MNHVLLAVESSEILAQVTALHVWGKETGFEITAVCRTLDDLEKVATQGSFQLILIETAIAELDDFQTLQRVREHHWCEYITLCSREGAFTSARKGIRFGVDDYLTLPLESHSFDYIFDKIGEAQKRRKINQEKATEELVQYFEKQDEGIYDYVQQFANDTELSAMLDNAVKKFFAQNDWMDLYYNEESFYAESTTDVEDHKTKIFQLFENIGLMNPHHNESFDNVIQHILYNPESDLRQKVLSEEFHLNKSYLSTVFTAQTGQRFVDYITYVKLTRAAWLLKNSNMKVNEVAERMDYKDIAYFSKQFKKQFHMTPTEYRIPENYLFHI